MLTIEQATYYFSIRNEVEQHLHEIVNYIEMIENTDYEVIEIELKDGKLLIEIDDPYSINSIHKKTLNISLEDFANSKYLNSLKKQLHEKRTREIKEKEEKARLEYEKKLEEARLLLRLHEENQNQ